MEDWAGRGGAPDWLRPRFYQAFEVETICRALSTIERGTMPTKPEAVGWALKSLPEPWRDLLKRSQEWRQDHDEDTSEIENVKAFARWAVSEMDT